MRVDSTLKKEIQIGVSYIRHGGVEVLSKRIEDMMRSTTMYEGVMTDHQYRARVQT